MNNYSKFIPTAPEGMPITDMVYVNAQFPGVAEVQNQLYVHYQKYFNGHDTLECGTLGEKGIENIMTLSGEGEVLYPVSLSFNGAVCYAWSETRNGGWAVCIRWVRNGEAGPIITVEEGEAVFYPNLFVHCGQLYLTWTRQKKNAAEAVLCTVDGETLGAAEVISVCGEVYRSNGWQGTDGNLYLAYDAYLNGRYHTLVRARTAHGWTNEIQLDNTDEWTCQSRVIAGGKGATVCWYSFGYGATFSVCYADVWVENGQLVADAPATIAHNVGWYMDLHATCSPTGLQVLTYTWSKDQVQVRCRVNGGNWTEPAMMSYEDKHCAVHPFVLTAENDEILLAWQYALTNGHFDRNAQVVVSRFTMDDVVRRGDPTKEGAENYFCRPIPAEKCLSRRTDEEVAAWLKKNGYDCKLLFGDIHGQSGISDGMGTIDQYYRRSRDKADLQFSCLTDHDCYPDWISQSEWELMRTTARLMNTDDELTCLLSFEWTPNEYKHDYGHKNVYYRDDEGDIFRSCDQGGKSPTDLYASLKRFPNKAMCIPHHPAADWGHVSAATDWNFNDYEVERLAEIMSRHAPYETDDLWSDYTKNIKKFPRHSVQEALRRGYRMGFTAGSDSHQMEHGVEGGIVAVYTPTHNRPGVWDAMYDRRTYGTTGARILVSLKALGEMMGSELKLEAGKPLELEISVLGTQNVKVELIKNNVAVAAWEPDCDAVDAIYVDEQRSESDYYYLRVTQPDNHMAWSSPIWVDAL